MPFLAEQKAKATLLGDCAPTGVLMSERWWPLQTLHSTDSRLWSFTAVGRGWVAAESGAL